MIVVFFEWIFVYLLLLWVGIVNALRFNPEVLDVVEQRPESAWVIGGIVFLAGASTLLGESAILFINRVRKGRFVLSLVTNGIVFMISYAVWAFTNTVGRPVVALRNKIFQRVSGSKLDKTNEDILLRFSGATFDDLQTQAAEAEAQ